VIARPSPQLIPRSWHLRSAKRSESGSLESLIPLRHELVGLDRSTLRYPRDRGPASLARPGPRSDFAQANFAAFVF
jgi:hypothetical protein